MIFKFKQMETKLSGGGDKWFTRWFIDLWADEDCSFPIFKGTVGFPSREIAASSARHYAKKLDSGNIKMVFEK